jgi:phosphoglycerate dehydrogenase-like enzyme
MPHYATIFAPETLAHLSRFSHVVVPDGDTAALGAQLPQLLPQVDACLTGWGAPPLSPDLLASADQLAIIAHAAGSIKALVPPAAFARGIVVCHAADIIAAAVAEATLLLMLSGLRRFHLFDQALKKGRSWSDVGGLYAGHQLAGRTIGLVGCGKVARQVIGLLQPFGVRILVYDPYLSDAEAAHLGVSPAPLERVMAESDIVSNHAPSTPATQHLIGTHELALLRDNVLFINTARAWTVDDAALLAELRRGRFWAALDVFETEPLPEESPLRRLPNVFLTPHKAGQTVETYRRQGAAMVEELERFFRGEPLRYQVSPHAYAIMA